MQHCSVHCGLLSIRGTGIASSNALSQYPGAHLWRSCTTRVYPGPVMKCCQAVPASISQVRPCNRGA